MSERENVASRSQRLSLAVALRDSVTGRRPRDSPRVTVDGDRPVVWNPSGYALFFDRTGTVTVRVEGGARYLDTERAVDVSTLAPRNPVVDVELTPAPAYRFPVGSTLVRGVVHDQDADPVPGASVSIVDTDRATTTDANGEFVLCFDPVTAADVAEVDGQRLVQVADADPRLAVTADGQATPVVDATVNGVPVAPAESESGSESGSGNSGAPDAGPGRGRGRGGGVSEPVDTGAAETAQPSGGSITADGMLAVPVPEGVLTVTTIII